MCQGRRIDDDVNRILENPVNSETTKSPIVAHRFKVEPFESTKVTAKVVRRHLLFSHVPRIQGFTPRDSSRVRSRPERKPLAKRFARDASEVLC